jgi:hypothetical protein
LVGAVPLVVIYAVLLYLFSPLFITAVTNANLQLWRFDFMLTAFILVYIFIFVFLIWSVYLAVRLISRIREIHRP